MDADEDYLTCAAIALEDLVSDTRQRSPELLGAEDGLACRQKTPRLGDKGPETTIAGRSLSASRDRLKGRYGMMLTPGGRPFQAPGRAIASKMKS